MDLRDNHVVVSAHGGTAVTIVKSQTYVCMDMVNSHARMVGTLWAHMVIASVSASLVSGVIIVSFQCFVLQTLSMELSASIMEKVWAHQAIVLVNANLGIQEQIVRRLCDARWATITNNV